MVAIKVSKTWEYWLDERGNAKRTLPAGNVYDVDLDVAAAAIAEGYAEAARPVTPALAAAVDVHKRILDGLAQGLSPEEAYDLAHQGVAGAPGPDTVPGGHGTTPPVRAKLTKAALIDGERYAKGVEVDGELAARLIAEGVAVAVAA